jgi:hypothetical protein
VYNIGQKGTVVSLDLLQVYRSSHHRILESFNGVNMTFVPYNALLKYLSYTNIVIRFWFRGRGFTMF